MRAFGPLAACALAAALAGGGCSKSPTGYGVHFTMILDGSIGDGEVDRVTTLEVKTDNSFEMFSTRLPTDDRFHGRKATMTYRPKASGGSLTFELRVRDAKDGLIGEGSAGVTLLPGTIVEATVTLVNPATLPVDMGPTYDFIIPDLSMPDMTMPPPPPDMAMPPPPRPDMTVVAPPPDMTLPVPLPDLSLPLPDLSTPGG